MAWGVYQFRYDRLTLMGQHHTKRAAERAARVLARQQREAGSHVAGNPLSGYRVMDSNPRWDPDAKYLFCIDIRPLEER